MLSAGLVLTCALLVLVDLKKLCNASAISGAWPGSCALFASKCIELDARPGAMALSSLYL